MTSSSFWGSNSSNASNASNASNSSAYDSESDDDDLSILNEAVDEIQKRESSASSPIKSSIQSVSIPVPSQTTRPSLTSTRISSPVANRKLNSARISSYSTSALQTPDPFEMAPVLSVTKTAPVLSVTKTPLSVTGRPSSAKTTRPSVIVPGAESSSLLKTISTPDAGIVHSTTIVPMTMDNFVYPGEIPDACNISEAYQSECGTFEDYRASRINPDLPSSDLLAKYLLDRDIYVEGKSGKRPGRKSQCNALLQYARNHCHQQAYGFLKTRGDQTVSNYLTKCQLYQKAATDETKNANQPVGLYDWLKEQQNQIQTLPNEPQTTLKLGPREVVDVLERNLAEDAKKYFEAIKDPQDYLGQCDLLKMLVDREQTLTNMALTQVRTGMSDKDRMRQKMAIYNLWVPSPNVVDPKFIQPLNDFMQLHEYRNANIRYPKSTRPPGTIEQKSQTTTKSTTSRTS